MTDRSREASYRGKAADLRQVAQRMQFGDCRAQLEKIAEAFEVLAARLARQSEQKRDAAD